MADITLSEMKVQIGEQGITPDKLYPSEELLTMPLVKGAIDNAVEEAVEVKAAETEDQVKGLEKERDDLKKTVGDKDKEIEKVNNDVKPYKQKEQADKLAGMVKDSDLLKDVTKKEAAFIISRMDVSLMDIEDKDDQGEKIEAGIKEAQNEIKELGISFEKGKTKGTSENEEEDTSKKKTEEESNPMDHDFGKKEEK